MQDNAREHICEKLGLPCRCPMPKTDIHGEYKVDPITDIPDNIKGLLNVSIVRVFVARVWPLNNSYFVKIH